MYKIKPPKFRVVLFIKQAFKIFKGEFMEYVLQTTDLCKKYGGKLVLDGVNINVAKGDVYGFVGENGSGKTTVIRLICGLIFPESGKFNLFGVSSEDKNVYTARKKLGAIVETPSIYQNFSAYDNLKMQCEILNIKDYGKIKKVLEDVGLLELYSDKKKAGNFSLGMRQRLGIAMALLGEPEFLILDEPMNGLDPAGIVGIRELIIRLNREKGITFMISSHILNELSLVATKYGIISKGKIIKEITAEQLKHECRPSTMISTDKVSDLYAVLVKIIPEQDLHQTPNGIKVYGDFDLNLVLKAVIDAGVKILGVNCNQTSIEDYYLSVIGGAKND